jgi:SAM-dependent methyltransferase
MSVLSRWIRGPRQDPAGSPPSQSAAHEPLKFTGNDVGRHLLAPPIVVDTEVTPAQRAALFQRVAAAWARLGTSDPHWSVLTRPQFRSASIREHEETFYQTGERDPQLVEAFFLRNGEDLNSVKCCLELGCGVGRATGPLAGIFEHVIAADVSLPHLDLARSHVAGLGRSNVIFLHLRSLEQFTALPKFDFFYSRIVLQHNPPPVIAWILTQIFAQLPPGGYAFFQVPTYFRGYSFNVEQYLSNREPDMAMHPLPMPVMYRIMDRNEMIMIELMEDSSTGSRRGLSYTFFAKKKSL